MDLRRLEVFCKVVELKSFTKAAAAMGLAQPTVSEHIRSLEEMLGERLVDRLGREVAATAAGRIFYQYSRNIVRLGEEAVQALDQFRGNLSGHLILGASTIPGTYVLPKLIGAFKARHPAVMLTLRIGDTTSIANEILQNDVEAAVVGSRWNDRRLISEEVFGDELILAVPSEHRWAGKQPISVEELAGEPFILRETGSGTRMVMAKILENHGFEPSKLHVVAEMGATEAVRQGIKAGIGISILSRHAVEEDIQRGTLSAVGIIGMRFLRPFYMIVRKNRHMCPICSAFVDFLRLAAKDNEQTGSVPQATA
jgi:DNA-binding transcriptional LysR family regulator